MQEVFVIGAGAGGIGAALELAKRGYKVTLIDRATIGSGTSGANPGRMGHGFHYVDVDTALMYLRESLRVQRTYSKYVVGQSLPVDHPLKHGRYFVTKNSDPPLKDMLPTFEAIRAEYARLVKEDPKNEVFGSPETFYRELDPSEYKDQVNIDIVETAFETNEHLFDWKAFVKDIKSEILANNNITLLEHTEVLSFERGGVDDSRFLLILKDKKTETVKKVQADYIVNSTWEKIEKLNRSVGVEMIPETRTNRLKCILIVKLPESLRNAHSMFFCMGQHCMFSNLGDGTGMVTYANVTNMEVSTGLGVSERATRLLSGGATEAEKEILKKAMLEGTAKYIPEMANAIPLDVRFGIVQTLGALTLNELNDPKNDFNKRNYDNIRLEQVGLISNPCIKHFYFLKNGVIVCKLIFDQTKAYDLIKESVQTIVEALKKDSYELNRDVKKAILGNMERHVEIQMLTKNALQAASDLMTKTMQRNRLVLQELKSKYQTKNAQNLLHLGLFNTKCSESERQKKEEIRSSKEKSSPKLNDISSTFLLETVSTGGIDDLSVFFLVVGFTALAIGTFGADAAVIFCVSTVVSATIWANNFFSKPSIEIKIPDDDELSENNVLS